MLSLKGLSIKSYIIVGLFLWAMFVSYLYRDSLVVRGELKSSLTISENNNKLLEAQSIALAKSLEVLNTQNNKYDKQLNKALHELTIKRLNDAKESYEQPYEYGNVNTDIFHNKLSGITSPR